MLNSDAVFMIFAIVVPMVELLGIIAAIHAVMNARTSQGAIAWGISLVTFPWIALVLYTIFGRNKFKGYVLLRNSKEKEINFLPQRHRELRVCLFFIQSLRGRLDKTTIPTGNKMPVLAPCSQRIDAFCRFCSVSCLVLFHCQRPCPASSGVNGKSNIIPSASYVPLW